MSGRFLCHVILGNELSPDFWLGGLVTCDLGADLGLFHFYAGFLVSVYYVIAAWVRALGSGSGGSLLWIVV